MVIKDNYLKEFYEEMKEKDECKEFKLEHDDQGNVHKHVIKQSLTLNKNTGVVPITRLFTMNDYKPENYVNAQSEIEAFYKVYDEELRAAIANPASNPEFKQVQNKMSSFVKILD